MINKMKIYSFNVPSYCIGKVLGELCKHGAYIRESEPLNQNPVVEETFVVEAELDPNEYAEFQCSLAKMIEQGPSVGPFFCFCGKSKSEAKHLLRSASPDVNICDTCVNECLRIINDSSGI